MMQPSGYAVGADARKDYENQTCSVAGALEVVGERWSLLIVREVFLGVRRFDEIQANLGIARNVLQTRLSRLVDQGVLEKRLYSERPPRYEYRLTEKGLDLWPTLVALCTGATATRAPGGTAGAARTPRLRRRASTGTGSAPGAASDCPRETPLRVPGPVSRLATRCCGVPKRLRRLPVSEASERCGRRG